MSMNFRLWRLDFTCISFSRLSRFLTLLKKQRAFAQADLCRFTVFALCYFIDLVTNKNRYFLFCALLMAVTLRYFSLHALFMTVIAEEFRILANTRVDIVKHKE